MLPSFLFVMNATKTWTKRLSFPQEFQNCMWKEETYIYRQWLNKKDNVYGKDRLTAYSLLLSHYTGFPLDDCRKGKLETHQTNLFFFFHMWLILILNKSVSFIVMKRKKNTRFIVELGKFFMAPRLVWTYPGASTYLFFCFFFFKIS